jgi:stearoyl-CoA desaturase (Delta-9 desaturase)
LLELIYLLICTHITILCVTIFLHRAQAHKTLVIHPILAHPMRFWLWLTTGMITKEWVAVHRKHHRYCDQPQDPHSPVHFGIWKVLLQGAWLYTSAANDKNMVAQYGAGTPDDWVERNVYTKFPLWGIILLLIVETALFNGWGIVIWLIQMAWIPFWAAGVVNGLGHYLGYRNGETRDKSRNIIPIDLIVGGELLHNNHHLNPNSAKLSLKWFEFDIGWFYIKIFQSLKLIKIKE